MGNLNLLSQLADIFMSSLASDVQLLITLDVAGASETPIFGRQILAMRLLPGAAEKWLTCWRIGEKESNTDRETIFHFTLDLFFIEFLAPLFPSLRAESFQHCLEDGKTHVGGRRRLIFQRGSSMPKTRQMDVEVHTIAFPLTVLAATWCTGTTGKEGSSRVEVLKFVIHAPAMESADSLHNYGVVLHSRYRALL